MIILGCW